ncbi:dihydrodipicolinate synthase family protein [Metabacillus arenae]|uniref:Dihydrodipicolinate synthase family protein n=1 Tax=Metabacillus arenae TaxID=2771434 RepID=A0A926ND06_9BACI|nr:dihydrodipicolinate synthase family protein [Metabacillus arenae]MBD1381997.1 dihydrodipicolinate synthase family protein [Metabacillus arenae]
MKNVKIDGVISTIVTPFNADDSVNEEMLRNEVRYILDSEVDGICACGSTGEGHTLTIEESARICEIVVEEVKGKIPVVGGIIQNSTHQVIKYGKALKDVGVDALQITPVHYLFDPGIEGTINYFKELGEVLDMPIIIYNVVPWALIPIEVIEDLAELPHVIGIKQSAGEMHLLADLLIKVKGKITILAAIDDLHYPAFVMGVDGTLAAIPTVTPHLTVQLWKEVQNGNYEKALKLHETILPIWNAIKEPNMPSKLKEALRLQGRNVGKARKPIQPVTKEESEKIYEALKNAGLLAKSLS